MLLTVDIGNTMIDFGVADNGILKETFTVGSNSLLTSDEAAAKLMLFLNDKGIKKESIKDIIISSVVPSLTTIATTLARTMFKVRPLVVGAGLKTGVKIDVDNPREVGADIVADCSGALTKYGPKTIIADLGTANKIILVDDKGAFSGLVIGTGIKVGLDSLVSKTSLLPEVSLTTPKSPLGKNTLDCMNSAFTYGTVYFIRGYVEAIEKQVGYKCNLLLTGGNSKIVKDLLSEFHYEKNLVLEGLINIAKLNGK